MMKTIGFIDIHPNNPVWGQHPGEREADANKDDLSAIQIFRKIGNQYTFEKTAAFHHQEATAGIDEFYVSIPAAMLDFRILNFPFPDKEKIRKATPLELDALIMTSPDDIIFDTVILSDNAGTVTVLVVYMQKDILQKLLDALMLWNVDPCVVTSLDLRMMTDAREKSGIEASAASIAEWLTAPMNRDQPLRIDTAREEISTPLINLRSGSLAYQKETGKTRRALWITVFLGILLAVIIHAGLLTQTIMFKQKNSSIERDMHTSYRKLFPADRKVIDELYQLKSHLKETSGKTDMLAGTDPLRLIRSLSQRMEPNVVYSEIHLEKGIIRMKAEARSMDDLSRIQPKLSEFLSDVSISDIKPTERGKILFTVVAKEQR